MGDIHPPTDLVHEVGQMIVQDERINEHPWRSLSLVVVLDSPASMSGYVYDQAGKATPENPEDYGIFDACRRLRDAMQRDNPTKRAWRAALFQIQRPDMKATFQFEYDDPQRWEVTPQNVETMPEALRPK
jgi:hypothetical protein